MIGIIWVVKFDILTFNTFIFDIDMVNAVSPVGSRLPYKLFESLCFQCDSHQVVLFLPVIKVEVPIYDCWLIASYQLLKNLDKLLIIMNCCAILGAVHSYDIIIPE